jgi:hypothetical protein
MEDAGFRQWRLNATIAASPWHINNTENTNR